MENKFYFAWLNTVVSLCRPAAAAKGCEPSVDRADAQQASDAGGHI